MGHHLSTHPHHGSTELHTPHTLLNTGHVGKYPHEEPGALGAQVLGSSASNSTAVIVKNGVRYGAPVAVDCNTSNSVALTVEC